MYIIKWVPLLSDQYWSYFLRPVHGQNLATPPQRFPSPWLLQRECFFFSNILTKSHERCKRYNDIRYTQSLSTFQSLMELDTKGFSPFCYWIQRPNGLFWSFADRDVNSPIFSSPMGYEKNSHQFESSRINDDNKDEFAFTTDTATTTLIRLVPR